MLQPFLQMANQIFLQKGPSLGWTFDTLAFADIRSPDTMNNLRVHPDVEINVIDPILS